MFEVIFDYVDKDQFFKYLKLVIIVAGYLFFREIYSNHMKIKQVEKQLKEDEEIKANKPEADRKKREEEDQRLENEAKTFGWGKRTRKNAKLAQRAIEDRAEETYNLSSAYNAAEDHDIDYLLEDWVNRASKVDLIKSRKVGK